MVFTDFEEIWDPITTEFIWGACAPKPIAIARIAVVFATFPIAIELE
jgi:hypothetical protein